MASVASAQVLVVTVLGLAALMAGAALPDWIDPIMGRAVLPNLAGEQT